MIKKLINKLVSKCNESVCHVSGIIVDLEKICALKHSCKSIKCEPEVCCCCNYIVPVTDEEASRITNYIPVAAKYAKNLLKNNEYSNVFLIDDDGSYYIEGNDLGWCAFAYRTQKNKIRCSLHSAAIECCEDVNHVKPSACYLWPLILVNTKPPLLTVQYDIYRFPCNRKLNSEIHGVDDSVLEIIYSALGKKFYKELLSIFVEEGLYHVRL